MTEHDENELQKLLKSWDHEAKKNPEFKSEVHHRIHEHFFVQAAAREENIPFFRWLRLLISTPIYASATTLAIALVTVLITIGVHQGFHPRDPGKTPVLENYQAVLEPAETARLMVANSHGFESLDEKPVLSKDSFKQALFWIEKEVKLDPKQVAEFQLVHERFFSKYERLCGQLIHMENEYRQFERKRVAGEAIDLFSVYANFQQQKSIYQQTIQLQQELIQEVSTFLTPQQQGAYGQLFRPAPSTNTPTPPSAWITPPTREWQI